MYRVCLSILLSIVPIVLYSQNTNDNNLLPGSVAVSEFDARYEGVKGTPFLFEDWMPGYVVNNTGEKVKAKFKYNLVTDQFIAKNTVSYPITLYDDFIDSVFITNNDKTWVFARLKDREEIKTGFYQIIYDGKISVIAKKFKVLEKANYKAPYTEEQTYDEYEEETRYYANVEDGSYSKLRLSKRGIKKTFNFNKKSLKGFLKKHREINVKTENGFIETIKFLETILE